MGDAVWLEADEYHESKPPEGQMQVDLWLDGIDVGAGVTAFGYHGEAFWIRYWPGDGPLLVEECRDRPCECPDKSYMHVKTRQRMLEAGETPPQLIVDLLMAKMRGAFSEA